MDYARIATSRSAKSVWRLCRGRNTVFAVRKSQIDLTSIGRTLPRYDRVDSNFCGDLNNKWSLERYRAGCHFRISPIRGSFCARFVHEAGARHGLLSAAFQGHLLRKRKNGRIVFKGERRPLLNWWRRRVMTADVRGRFRFSGAVLT